MGFGVMKESGGANIRSQKARNSGLRRASGRGGSR
jgi:hypothetical protein